MSGRYVASNENPLVLCAYGNSPAEAFKEMSKLMKKEKIVWFSGASVDVLDDNKDQYAVTVYV
jgi:hypothetical protein